jgi:cation diffusion facilitator CzcD-associated flavoprotein CzcO
MKSVAIVGAGPAGLVAAKYLQQHGFDPVILEQSGDLGGQWQAGAAHSGVWPAMRTNTSRVVTCFSDLPHAEGVPVYPHNRDMHAYLHRYAREHGLTRRVELDTRVVEVDGDDAGGWRVDSLAADGTVRSRKFEHVVIATGRYAKPKTPAVPGLETFAGEGGVSHAFAYRGPERYRGMNVVVAGGNISALEIASELAHHAASVVSSQRRQRYVFSKLVGGVPAELVAFTRFAALAGESFPPAASAQALKDMVLRASGRPDALGALAPSDSVLEAGITLSQHFLPLVAEGRIVAKPWISRVDGRTVTFRDGTSVEADALIFGTGFEAHLPFLSERVRRTVRAGRNGLELFAQTFHPEHPRLAFLGQFDIVGPFFPVIELQARWLAYAWSGARPLPSRAELVAGIEAQRPMFDGPVGFPMHALAVQLARLAGAEPDVRERPALARALLFGPLTPVSFRLTGPDALPNAAARTAAAAAEFGVVPDSRFTEEQRAQVRALAAARMDSGLAALAAEAPAAVALQRTGTR